MVYAGSDSATKAEYLYRVAAHVQTWPSSEQLVFCVLGPDPFGSALTQVLKQKTIKNFNLVKKNIGSASQIGQCNILFVTGNGHISSVLQQRNAGVLTVSDTPNFAKLGGMINFVPSGQHIRLHINRKSLQNAGIRISSRLLRQAEKTY